MRMNPKATLLLLFVQLILINVLLASLAPQAQCKPVVAPAQLLRQRRHERVLTAERECETAPHSELPEESGGAGGGPGEDDAPGAGSVAPGPEGTSCSCHWPPGEGRRGRVGDHQVGGGHEGGDHGSGGEGSGDGGRSECHCGPHGGGGGGWNGYGGGGRGPEGGGGGGGGGGGDVGGGAVAGTFMATMVWETSGMLKMAPSEETEALP